MFSKKTILYFLLSGWVSVMMPSQVINKINSGVMGMRTCMPVVSKAAGSYQCMRTESNLLKQPSKPSAMYTAYKLHQAINSGSTEQIVNTLKSTSHQKKILNARVDNSTALLGAAASDNPDVAQLFVARGAQVNVADNYGRTPLHLAAYQGHACLVEKLVQAGAYVNAADKNSETPLHKAVQGVSSGSMQSSKLQTVAILLASGANRDATNKNGHKPFDYNGDNQEIIADQIKELFNYKK